MPVKSQQQRKFIFAKRGQYGDEKHTPKEWKWYGNQDGKIKENYPKESRKRKKIRELMNKF